MLSKDERSVTNKRLSTLLSKVLGEIGALHHNRPDLILAAWPEIIGPKLAPMTRAVSFEKGILMVKVAHSTLYSVLCQQERGRLLRHLRQKFPSVEIKNIYFRIG